MMIRDIFLPILSVYILGIYLQKYIPCQVPRFKRPSVMGMVMLTPLSVDFAWAGISSAPSSVCSYSGRFSGTRRLKIVSISMRTSESQFSLMLSPQLVCFVKMFTMPVFGNFGNWLRISLVTKWKPRRFGFRIISICCTITGAKVRLKIDMRRFPYSQIGKIPFRIMIFPL